MQYQHRCSDHSDVDSAGKGIAAISTVLVQLLWWRHRVSEDWLVTAVIAAVTPWAQGLRRWHCWHAAMVVLAQ